MKVVSAALTSALLVSGCSQIIDYQYSKSDFTTQSFDADISQCKRQNTSADSLELRTQERDDTMVHQCMTANSTFLAVPQKSLKLWGAHWA
jgi:hypothetical protein